MTVTLDHLVLKLRNEAEMIAFYTNILGLKAERLEDYRSGRAPFPSIRINATTVIDLFPTTLEAPVTPNLDHFCLTLDGASWEQVRQRLTEHDVEIDGPHTRWGALGDGRSIYVTDPDGNAVELKTHDD
jgi:catechol-2,3-dioxygenase